MKAALPFLFAALAAAAAAPPAKAPGGTPVDEGIFVPIDPGFKKPVELGESFFNPFKVQAFNDADGQGRHDLAVTDHAVTEALDVRGISGVLYAPDGKADRVIIGDQVFGLGDELIFPTDGKDGPVPLVQGAAVVLHDVARDDLGLEVTPTDGPARHMNYSLKAFWRP